MPITVIKNKLVAPGQFGEVFMRIEPWYEGMPEPKGS